MSELKVYHHELRHNEYENFYLKYEADKVIAEKDAEIVELKKQVLDYAQGLYVIQARADKDARHNKYKRCLAMAEMCTETAKRYYYLICLEGVSNPKYRRFPEKMDFWMKWHKRWLELAEKFKETKFPK